MKTTLTRVTLLSAAIGLFSAGAIAHQDNPEAGPYHYFKHLSESRGQTQATQDQTGMDAGMASEAQRGAQGPVRTESAGDNWKEVQRDLDRGLGGIGGAGTN